MFRLRDRTELTLFRAGTVPETVPVRSLRIRHRLDIDIGININIGSGLHLSVISIDAE